MQSLNNTKIIFGTVENIVGNSFILDNAGRQVIVDAGSYCWHEIDVFLGEEVTVIGELGEEGEFDAFSITKSDGTVIQIRPATDDTPL